MTQPQPSCPALPDRIGGLAAAAAHDATSAGTWFATAYPESVNRTIAYFCAEFGLHASVPIYSGGLGVLAGDQCKAASDLGVPLVGVGLFYRSEEHTSELQSRRDLV